MTDMNHNERWRRVYRFLLRLYPEAFRSEYADSLEGAFADLRREASTPIRRVMLWVRTVWDLVRSAATEHANVPRPERDPKCRRQWITTMGAAGAAGPLLGVWVAYLLRPIELALDVRIVSTWAFTGAFLGVMIGGAQAILLRKHGISPRRWIAASIAGGIAGWFAGMYAARYVATVLLSGFVPDLVPVLVMSFIPGLILGVAQWWVLRRTHQDAHWWIAANLATAMALGFAGWSLLDVAVSFQSIRAFLFVYAAIMSMFGVMTASPMEWILRHPRQDNPTVPDSGLQVASD